MTKIFARGTSNACAGAFAAALALGSARVVGVPRPALPLLLAFLVTTFCYALDRFVDPSPGSRHARRALLLAGGAWVAGVISLAAMGHAVPALHSLLFPLSVLAYACPWMRVRFGSRTFRRVKDFPFTKPLYVALMWAQLAVSAALFGPRPPWRLLLAITTWIFLKATVNAAACDLDDVDEDRMRGVMSWPVLLGRAKTVRVLQLLNVSSASLVIAPVMQGAAPRSLAWVELLSVHLALCLSMLGRTGATRNVGKLALDAGSALVLLPVATFALGKLP